MGLEMDIKYYFTAEKDTSAIFHRKNFYKTLLENGFESDVRHFKGKNVYCPSKYCKFNKDGFNLQI